MLAFKSFRGHIKIQASSETMNSHDDSVVIEIDDSPAIATRKSTRKKTCDVGDDEVTMLCEFPVGQSDTVTVSSPDYATLEHDTFLNDIIIDFYLTHLFYNVLPTESRDSVHIFSTMFYKRLLQTPTKDAKKVAAFETDPSNSNEEKQHLRVAGWTKNVDLFSKDVVIIPICEHAHWYLVVVVKPGLVNTSEDSEEGTAQGEPFFLVLDSLGGIKRSAVANVRQYLSCEWRSKKCGGDDSTKELQFVSSQMRSIYPEKPEQENGSDCGVFLLHYVEKIFEKLDQFLLPHLPDLSKWFTLEEVGKKRGEIAGLIQRLAKQQGMKGNPPKFPSIKFRAGPRTRKSPQLVDRSLSKEDSPDKDVNENMSQNEEVKSIKVTRLSKLVSTSSTYSIRDRQKKLCKSSVTLKETETPSSDRVEDFAFDPSIYSAIKTKSSGIATSLEDANTITTVPKSSHGTSSSDTTSNVNTMSFKSSAVTSAAISSSSTTSNFPTGKKASFLEMWNANKDDLVIGDYVRLGASSTATKDIKVKRKRHGLKMLKSLQLSSADDRIIGSNEVPNRKVQ